MEIKKLVETLNEYRQKYYKGIPVISDFQFDELENKLKNLNPNNDYFNKIGYCNNLNKKINHEIPLLSMNKVNSIEDFIKWLDKINCINEIFVGMPKIDGVSATLKYINGKLIYMATRGNGKVGNIINNWEKYKNIPKNINTEIKELEIRGELYLSNKDDKYKNKSLRNVVAGIIDRKNYTNEINDIRFCAFSIISKELKFNKFSESLDFLSKILGNNNVINNTLIHNNKSNSKFVNLENFINSFYNNKKLLDYDTDGIIFQIDNVGLYDIINKKYNINHHNMYNVAYKFKDVNTYTKAKNIVWRVTRLGKLIPVIILDPVEINNTIVTRATMHNCSNVELFGLGPKDIVSVAKANQIIPEVVSLIKKNNNNKLFNIPEFCPSCKTKLIRNSVHLICTNSNCKEKNIDQILYWIKSLGCKNIGYNIVKDLYENNIVTSIPHLYSIKSEELIKLDGYRQKKVSIILDQLKKYKDMTELDIMSCIGIPNVGKKTLEKYNIKQINDLLRYRNSIDNKYSTNIIENQIIDWIKDFNNYKLLKDIARSVNIKEDPLLISKGDVCISGTLDIKRNDLIKKLRNIGYNYTDRITNNTKYLLTSKNNSDTNKVKQAAKNKIKIVFNIKDLE